jgi:hypothetical protein
MRPADGLCLQSEDMRYDDERGWGPVCQCVCAALSALTLPDIVLQTRLTHARWGHAMRPRTPAALLTSAKTTRNGMATLLDPGTGPSPGPSAYMARTALQHARQMRRLGELLLRAHQVPCPGHVLHSRVQRGQRMCVVCATRLSARCANPARSPPQGNCTYTANNAACNDDDKCTSDTCIVVWSHTPTCLCNDPDRSHHGGCVAGARMRIQADQAHLVHR